MNILSSKRLNLRGLEILLGILFILYILFNKKTPAPIDTYFDTLGGNLLVTFMALVIFLNCNPVIGILAFIAAYLLVVRSIPINKIYQNKTDLVTHTVHSNPQDFPKYNDFPISLEEEMVEKMAPLVKYPSTTQSSYKPALNKIHDAADINYTGVI